MPDSQKIAIRAYRHSDLQAVLSLWQATGLTVPHNNPVKDIGRKLKVDRGLLLVGLLEDQVVATVMGGYEGHRGWINYLAVAPTEQKSGFGRQMMLAIENLLTERGCPKINLQLRSNNRAALGFYHALGYTNDRVVSLGKRIVPDE